MGILTLFKSFGLKVWAYVAAATLGLLFLLKIYQAGGQKKEIQDLNETLEALEKNEEVEKHIDRLSDDDVDRELRDNGWLRK